MIKFFKAKSRLGLINFPYGTTDRNVGVEDAPDFVLSADFLKQFSNHEVYNFTFSKPEDIDTEKYYDVICKESLELSQLITSNINDGDLQITIGGDHSISLATVHALSQIHKDKKIGFIQIDSHADIHNVSTSTTGNFHGMYLRPIFDKFGNAKIDEMFPKKYNIQNLMYIGNLDLEEEEKTYIKDKRLKIKDKQELINDEGTNHADIKGLITRTDHIHLGIDVDAFDVTEVRATGITNSDGLFLKDILPLIEFIVRNSKSLSVDLVEVNPKKDGAEETIELVHKILNLISNK